MTPEEVAAAYAATVRGPPNGWGQHVHPQLGASHFIMRKLVHMVGWKEAQRLIGEALATPAKRANDGE